jgi:NADPH-dependent curcumin reductase CurA
MEVVISDTVKLELPPESTAVIVKNLYISIDPYNLHLMARKDASGSTTGPLSVCL